MSTVIEAQRGGSGSCDGNGGDGIGDGGGDGGTGGTGAAPPTGPGGDHPDDYSGVPGFDLQPETPGERMYLVLQSNLIKKTDYLNDFTQYQRLVSTSLEDGNLTGDDFDSLLALSSQLIKEIGDAPDIALLSNGFFRSTRALLGRTDYYIRYGPKDFSPSIVEKHPVLVIPSGGLYGLDSSQRFKAKLEKYVLEGGTVIVFSQQHGYEFQALPGGNLTGYGWAEDQSCFAKAVYIDTYHPILSGQDSVTLDVNIDGYFTSWPENSTILFSRTANGMPAGVMYKYGNGTVIATTAFTDWAYTHGQRTGDGLALVRDMLAWAVANADGMEIPEYGRGDTVNISVPITNNGNSTVSMVVFNVINLDKNIVGNVSVPVVIATGETRAVDASYAVQSKAGVWTVDYELVNESGDTVQVGYDVAKFAVSGNFSRTFSKRLYSIGNISENRGC